MDAMIIACSECGRRNRVPAAKLAATPRCGACQHSLTPLTHPVSAGSAKEFDDLLFGSPLPIVADFWAEWCGPCRVVAPELEKLAKERSGQLVVAKVDTDALPDVAGRYAISGIPTLILFRQGRAVSRVSGAMPAEAIARELGLNPSS